VDIASLGIKIQTQGAKEATADLDKLDASATRVEASVKKIAPSARTSSEALALFSKIDPAAGKLAALDALESQLTKLSKAGKVGATDFAAMSAKLAESRAKIVGEGAAVAEASTLVQKFTSNTRLMSEASTIASDVVSGQFGRIRRSAAAMANASGVFRLAFTGTGALVLGVAAAVGALGLAAEKASNETQDFNNAILLTGNYADLTVGKLRKMADEIGHATGATTGKASEVLAQVASTGQFTAEQMQLVTKAAIEMEQATGRSIKETVKDFTALKGDPVEALLRLNEASEDGKGITHFLTQEVIEQVKALEDQGRKADATALALKALYDGIDQRAPAAAQNMSLMGSVLHTISVEAKQDLDAIVGFFRGADEGIRNFILGHEKLLRSMADVQRFAPFNIFGNATKETVDSLIDSAKARATPPIKIITGEQPVDSETERAFFRFRDEYLTKAASKQKALNDLEQYALQLHLKDADVAKIRAGIEEHFKKPKGPSGVALEGAENRRNVDAFEDELKREQGAIANQTQLLDANYAARNISAEKYYDEQKRLAKESTDAQVTALTGEIAVLQARNVKGKQSVDNARELAQKEAELAKVRADGAAKDEVLKIQEAGLLKQRQEALRAYGDALKDTEAALQDEMDAQVLRISTGEREFEIRSRINQLMREEAKELRDLARAKDADPLNPEIYDEQAKLVEQSFARQIQAVRNGYAAMATAQLDWKNGAIKAFQDYEDAANDVAGQVNGIFNDAFRGLEDTLVDFFTKGKADWKGFLDGIAAEITRFVVRQQLSKLYAKFMPGGDKGNTDQAAALSGAAGQLAASAGPLLGAAAALSASAAELAAAGGVSGGGGGGWMGALASIFSSDSSSTGGYGSWDGAIAAAFGGGRAYGGDVSPGKIYEVGENNQPEILQMHGRSYLLPGNQGNVTPISAARSGPTVVNQTVVVQGRIDSRTPAQFAQATAHEQNRAASRNR